MGNKKRKNSNYVTPKTIKAKEDKARAERNKKRNKIIIAITAAVLSVGIIVGTILTLGFTVFDWGEPTFKVTHHATIYIEGYDTPIHIELYGEEAPETVDNFVALAEEGYYNGSKFHRIVKGFMAQGGKDPTGYGTPTIKGEFPSNGVNNRIKHERGVISMARGKDYDSASDQFFIVQNTSGAKHLDGDYAAFGRVTSGMSVIDDICNKATPTDNNGTIIASQQPVIKSVSIHSAHHH